MRIFRTQNYQDLSYKAASIIAAHVVIKPQSVLGLATGSSPLGTYAQLIAWYQKGELDFSEVKTVNLDEYRGLGIDSDQSYVYYMHDNLFKHVNIKSAHIHIPDGTNMDADGECERYDKLIESLGGIDIQLLGIGRNGHIGFNEPSDHFIKDTHCVDLTESTIAANKRFFESEEDVPRQAYTMGVGAIMRAKQVLLIASGEDKADALYKTCCGPITSQVPASLLQLHPNVVIVADAAALSKIPVTIAS